MGGESSGKTEKKFKEEEEFEKTEKNFVWGNMGVAGAWGAWGWKLVRKLGKIHRKVARCLHELAPCNRCTLITDLTHNKPLDTNKINRR